MATDVEVTATMRTRALADNALLAVLMGAADSLDQAQQALAMAREVDDPALLVRVAVDGGRARGAAHFTSHRSDRPFDSAVAGAGVATM